MDIKNLEVRLNDFDPAVRKAALLEVKTAFENGLLEAAPASDIHNMHCHYIVQLHKVYLVLLMPLK